MTLLHVYKLFIYLFSHGRLSTHYRSGIWHTVSEHGIISQIDWPVSFTSFSDTEVFKLTTNTFLNTSLESLTAGSDKQLDIAPQNHNMAHIFFNIHKVRYKCQFNKYCNVLQFIYMTDYCTLSYA